MERINYFKVLEETLENFYATVENRDAKWPYVMLKAVLSVGGTRNTDSHRHVAMGVRALLTLSEVERELFLGDYELPPIIERNMSTDPAWPDMLPIADYEPISVADVEAFRRYALDQANYLVGQARLQLITNIPGQDMIYLQKEREATDYLLESPEPATLEDYPFLAAEVGITAATALEVATLYATQAGQFRIAGAQLENARLGTILAVETAVDTATMETALDALRATLVPSE